MKIKRLIYLGFLSLTILFISLHLVQSQEITLEYLIETSNLIIVGRVKNIFSAWENSNIWTYVTVEINQTLKGNSETKEIVIRSLGGTVGEINQDISEGAKFTKNETLLSFLIADKKKKGIYYCLHGKIGKYIYDNGSWLGYNSKQSNSFTNQIKDILKSR
ncbi:hypothetical protein JW935_24655 [candidate division KSB1 bacterium]|nr:hypothetical protein [candidate division KSB1 bacterium]